MRYTLYTAEYADGHTSVAHSCTGLEALHTRAPASPELGTLREEVIHSHCLGVLSVPAAQGGGEGEGEGRHHNKQIP